MSITIGIDFGTTRSAVVKYNLEKTVIEKAGVDPILSVAAVSKTSGICFYGADADAKYADANYEYIPSLKDLLSKDYDKYYGSSHLTTLSILTGFFQYLKNKVGISEASTDIVMAIPNDFPAERRKIIREAAFSAGFSIKFFINEPVAAFFANYSRIKEYDNSAILRNAEHIAIFDWGGGTLDITVMSNEGRVVKELAKNRMDCAGNAIDDRFARYVHQRIMESRGDNISFDDVLVTEQHLLRKEAEETKRQFNSSDPMNNRVITLLKYNGKPAFVRCSSQEFNNSVEYIVDAAVKLLKDTITESGLGIAGIDKILVVGGSAKLLLLQEKLQNEFGDKLLISGGDSDWGVAIGAAALSARPGDFIVNQNIALKLNDGSVFPLIKKGTKISDYQKIPLTFCFGKVDDSAKAVFAFTGSEDIDKSGEKYLTIQTMNIWDESIQLDVSIDENLIVNVVGSCRGVPVGSRRWIYANLSCCYALPED